ncbi:hypothetical protein K413DRAFT_4611 [Clostridium sp. ASBs410]|nr:hypothetical protein K413DRAFT_4611 [Clostridium sp. ASBs410]
MKISDLKTGMFVKDRSGCYGIVLRDTPNADVIKWIRDYNNKAIDTYSELNGNYIENLEYAKGTYGHEGRDIVTVYQPADYVMCMPNDLSAWDKYIIWERIEPKYKVGAGFRFGKIRSAASCDGKESVKVDENGIAEIVSINSNSNDHFFYTIKTRHGNYHTVTEEAIDVLEELIF